MQIKRCTYQLVAVLVMLAVTVMGSTQAQAAPSPPPLSGSFAPAVGTLWGAYANEAGGYQALEPKLGRKLAVVQKYIPWGYSSWSWGIGPVIASGHAVLLSWSAAGTTSAAAIASGSQDGVIRNAAIQLKALGGVILLRPFFEFDQPVGHPRYIGSPAQVVAAWQRTYTIFKSVGVPNVRFVWSPMAFDFARGVAQQFWPGSAYVDWVGPDGYNFPGRSFRDWQTIFGSAYEFAVAQHKPMMIPETASPATDPRTPGWLIQGAAWIQAHPDVRSVNYFDSISPKGYDFRLSVNPQVLAAFRSWGQQSYFSPMD